jgi:hypothetical protein
MAVLFSFGSKAQSALYELAEYGLFIFAPSSPNLVLAPVGSPDDSSSSSSPSQPSPVHFAV